MATGTAKAPDFNVEASSTEVMELIPGKIKATFAGDIYIKSGTEQNFFCNVIHLTCFDKNRIVVVDDAVSTESRFAFSSPEPGKFRVKLVDTTLKQVVSVLDVPGKFSGMTNIGDTRLAVCVDGNKIVLLRADENLTAEKSVKFPSQHDTNKYEITHLSTYEDDLYICSGREISKVDMIGKTAQVFKSTSRTYREYMYTSQEFISSAMYKDGDKTFMYAITVDNVYNGLQNKSIRSKPSYLAHGTGTVGVMDKITTLVPGEPKIIVMDDDLELLFVLLCVENKRDRVLRGFGHFISNHSNDEENSLIYALRPGTTDGCVLLDKADGLQDVTSMAYCSKTRKLFVGSTENNYVKVYQLSSMP